ncbi:hypothetical protein [Saccharibacillus sacchari]|uniref:hypothetical protein n=1 Tax=Saccharibacillus sacchari TaxID=456493 RepID=UPI0004BA3665|nr:hypothetical protein [Saccharibacillus sacchari]
MNLMNSEIMLDKQMKGRELMQNHNSETKINFYENFHILEILNENQAKLDEALDELHEAIIAYDNTENQNDLCKYYWDKRGVCTEIIFKGGATTFFSVLKGDGRLDKDESNQLEKAFLNDIKVSILSNALERLSNFFKKKRGKELDYIRREIFITNDEDEVEFFGKSINRYLSEFLLEKEHIEELQTQIESVELNAWVMPRVVYPWMIYLFCKDIKLISSENKFGRERLFKRRILGLKSGENNSTNIYINGQEDFRLFSEILRLEYEKNGHLINKSLSLAWFNKVTGLYDVDALSRSRAFVEYLERTPYIKSIKSDSDIANILNLGYLGVNEALTHKYFNRMIFDGYAEVKEYFDDFLIRAKEIFIEDFKCREVFIEDFKNNEVFDTIDIPTEIFWDYQLYKALSSEEPYNSLTTKMFRRKTKIKKVGQQKYSIYRKAYIQIRDSEGYKS